MASPDEMMATMVANLQQKTGKDLAEWLAIATRSKLQKHGEVVKHLKTEHGLTHGYANMIAHRLLASDAGSLAVTTDLVAAQYAGPKAGLRPIYEALRKAIQAFGDDVEFAPKKAYVSLRRTKQFGLIQPSTATRVDLGLNLPGAKAAGRLEASGSFSAMCTHRVKLTKVADVDQELVRWLRQAYSGA